MTEHKHVWHLSKSDDMQGQFNVMVWVCECNAIKRHVFPIGGILVYDPDNLQPHSAVPGLEIRVEDMP